MKFYKWAARTNSNDEASKFSAEAPLRAELFSSDQMDQHGRFLGSFHQPVSNRRPDQLLARLIENYAVLMWGAAC